MTAFEKRIKEWTPSQLAAEGYALFGLVAKPDGYLFRERIFRFSNPLGDGLLPSQHQFTQVSVCGNLQDLLHAFSPALLE